jgi:hypothetical protein
MAGALEMLAWTGTRARRTSLVLTGMLAVVLAGVLTWLVGQSIALGWIGLGLTLMSLPVGPALAVVATNRFFPSGSGPRIVPVVLSTWLGAALGLTVYVFTPAQHWPWPSINSLPVLALGAALGAMIGTAIPRRHAGTS